MKILQKHKLRPAVKHGLIGLGMTVGLGACAATTPALQAGTPEFGSAVKHNIAAHAIAPTQAQKNNTHIPADITRRNLAREAYRKGETPDPKPAITTD